MLELACTGPWELIMHIFSHLHIQWQHIASLKSPQWEYLHHRNQQTLHTGVLCFFLREPVNIYQHTTEFKRLLSHLVCGCNSHAFSLLQTLPLQSFSNMAGHCDSFKIKCTRDHVITALKLFYWLPVLKFKQKYRYFTLVYKALNHLSSGYLSGLISYTLLIYSTPTATDALSTSS